ncbi:cadherin-1-like isoform X2 [Podarcis lilfordi]|uniref:hydroxyisourate hydrolase n=1 Tax=Podarcis lilfordi TaxID=74358 RepID=A0AA35KQ58_9SAUR|nr:cadherin-1-like isoform X2 [Podarcis lilfordi]
MCFFRVSLLLFLVLHSQVSFLFAWADVLTFPESRLDLKRQKRDLQLLPPILVMENGIGPYPKRLLQVGKDGMTFYSVTGTGADRPPQGIFILERETGWLMVTMPLDRETKDKYILFLHAVSATGQPVGNRTEIVIKVLDQNDNKPRFTQSIFHGSVAEGAPPGTFVTQVSATDMDDAVNSYNGVITYSLAIQTPTKPQSQMFAIDNKTGVISLNKPGLDRTVTPQYTLILQATDCLGEGLSATATAVIQVASSDEVHHAFLTVHALNVLTGLPAQGLAMHFSKLEDPQRPWAELMRSKTNPDGRLDRNSPMPRELKPGTYKLRFETREYWEQQGYSSFYPYVEIVFTITEEEKVHIPLLLSPYSYTTYRGS